MKNHESIRVVYEKLCDTMELNLFHRKHLVMHQVQEESKFNQR